MFRTEVNVAPAPFRISHRSALITTGSCFSTVIGQRLKESKFNVSINPYGVIFNPLSLLSLLQSAVDSTDVFDGMYMEREGTWFNFLVHSELWANSKQDLEEKLRNISAHTQQLLVHAEVLYITFGTAYIYELKSGNQAVANCHKVPVSSFNKLFLSSEQIASAFDHAYSSLKKINPKLKIVLTVSPVRHIKDTLELNAVSKAILRKAAYDITAAHPEVMYFPSYEIMMDDLRDYRFYKEDMLHPSSLAEDYIWEKFMGCFMEEKTRQLIRQWGQLKKATEHKAFHPSSTAHQKFLRETISRLEGLSPELDVSEEISRLKKQLL